MKYLVTFILFVINLFCLYVFFIEPLWVETTYHSMPLRAGLEGLRGTRIVHISDLHLRRADLGRGERSLIRRVNRLKPDLVCVTGDHITRVKTYDGALELLESFTPAVRTYAVMGNADYQRSVALATTIKKRGIKKQVVLGRNAIDIATVRGTQVVIALIDDPILKYDDPSLFEDLSHLDGFKLVLIHSYLSKWNDNFFSVRRERSGALPLSADLILCGHTHGGQINILPEHLMLSWLQYSYERPIKYLRGFIEETNGDTLGQGVPARTFINVNRGIGVSGIPARFRSRPEISVITLGTP